MMEERQRAKPRANATWLVMQLQFFGSPRKTMEQRKVTTREKRSEKLSRTSLALTRGVPMYMTKTIWKNQKWKNWPFSSLKSKREVITCNCYCCTILTPTAMDTKAPKADMTIRVIPSGSPKARNSMIFGTQASWALFDQSSPVHRMHSRASVQNRKYNF